MLISGEDKNWKIIIKIWGLFCELLVGVIEIICVRLGVGIGVGKRGRVSLMGLFVFTGW